MTALIADDNRHMRQVVVGVLRSFGFQNVIECDDGSDAFAETRAMAVDLVICDWMMEPLDGYDFTRLVRTASDSPNPFVPIIMLTGHTELFRVMQARDAGVTEFLSKPVSSSTLWKRIISVIDHPRVFIRSPHYVGPDRRRRAKGAYSGPERRGGAGKPSAPAESASAASPPNGS
jgi:DNA-binding response OmpR family regulator